MAGMAKLYPPFTPQVPEFLEYKIEGTDENGKHIVVEQFRTAQNEPTFAVNGKPVPPWDAAAAVDRILGTHTETWPV
jgi:hypothetical protein